MFPDFMYDASGFLPVKANYRDKQKLKLDVDLKFGVGVDMLGQVVITIADLRGKPMAHIKLEPFQAMEIARSLGESAEMLYGNA